MLNRYTNLMLKAENGISFEVNEQDGNIIIRAKKADQTAKRYGTFSKVPIVPKNFTHLEGTVEQGYVIQRDSDGSQFTWIPVAKLQDNGLLSLRKGFADKFGRRSFMEDNFSRNNFHEPLYTGLLAQMESILKYGGFYVSSYAISKGVSGKPQSLPGYQPWTNVTQEDAKNISMSMFLKDSNDIKSHLLYGAEYDTILEWLLESGKWTEETVCENSSRVGNYWNNRYASYEVAKTGSEKAWEAGHIYDLAGNVSEWTQEENEELFFVARGGNCNLYGFDYPVAHREVMLPTETSNSLGFRVALYLK